MHASYTTQTRFLTVMVIWIGDFLAKTFSLAKKETFLLPKSFLNCKPQYLSFLDHKFTYYKGNNPDFDYKQGIRDFPSTSFTTLFRSRISLQESTLFLTSTWKLRMHKTKYTGNYIIVNVIKLCEPLCCMVR